MQALEYQMQQGMAEGVRQSWYLVPKSAQHCYGPPMQAECCALRLLQPEG